MKVAPKTAKSMVFDRKFRSRAVGAKKGKGSYKRRGKYGGHDYE